MRRSLALFLVLASCAPLEEEQVTGIVVRSPSGTCSDECAHDIGTIPMERETFLALSIANLGIEAVTGLVVALEGDSPLALAQEAPTIIAPRRTAPLLIAIQPRVPGPLRSDLSISTAEGHLVRLALSAEAHGDGIVLEEQRVCDFGQVPIGEVSSPCPVVLLNASTTDIALQHISVLPEIYSITPALDEAIVLAPLERHEIEIRATPVEAGRIFGSFAYGYEDTLFVGGVSMSVEGI